MDSYNDSWSISPPAEGLTDEVIIIATTAKNMNRKVSGAGGLLDARLFATERARNCPGRDVSLAKANCRPAFAVGDFMWFRAGTCSRMRRPLRRQSVFTFHLESIEKRELMTVDEQVPEPASGLWDLLRSFFATLVVEFCVIVIGKSRLLPESVAALLGWPFLIGPFIALAYPGVRCLIARRWTAALALIGAGLLLGFVVIFLATLMGFAIGGTVGI
jgi:hypothetical protein